MELIWLILAMALAFALTFLIMPRLIIYFREKQLGQTIREEGPEWHQEKSGTPTMGGVVFLIVGLFVSLLVALLAGALSQPLFLLFFLLIFFGGIGFIDDYRILILKKNEGITSSQKFIAQVIGGMIFGLVLIISGFDTSLPIFSWTLTNPILYLIFVVFWIVGFSNAVNLTDGIDGLSSSTSIVAFLGFLVIAYLQDRLDLAILILSLVGGLLAFLYYNKKPAQIFMGDVGSLALGAIFAGLAILLKVEWYLLLIGFIFVVETASVILQVSSFKLTGQRIFKMSPIHHHFEQVGWSERKIVAVFSLVNLLAVLIALWIYI